MSVPVSCRADVDFYSYDANAEADPTHKTVIGGQGTTQFLPYCVMDKNGEITFHLNYDPYTGSCYPTDPATKDFYYAMEGYDYSWGDTSRTMETVTLQAVTLDSLVEGGKVLPPDFLYLDTQGSELNILQGAEKTLQRGILGLFAEAEFIPLYQGQPLFSQLFDYLREQGFYLAKFLNIVDEPPYRGPVGTRAEGFTAYAHCLFLRDTNRVAGLPLDGADRRLLLLKLAFYSILYSQLEYALKCLAAAKAIPGPPLLFPPTEGEPSYFGFLRRLDEIVSPMATRLPPVFSEAYTYEQSKARFVPGQPGVTPYEEIVRRNESRVYDRTPGASPLEMFLLQHGLTPLAQQIHRRRHQL